jgi:hypothetical protein
MFDSCYKKTAFSPCGFASEGRASRESRVDFDDVVLLRLGIQCVLNVAFADNSQVSEILFKTINTCF